MPITETSGASEERASRAEKPIGDACFNDWKRFCFVLREIATGDNGRPLSGVEAQQRAQAVLTEYGYTWPGRAPGSSRLPSLRCQESANEQAPVDSRQSRIGTKLKSVGKAQWRSGRRRSEQRPTQHRVDPFLNSIPGRIAAHYIPRALRLTVTVANYPFGWDSGDGSSAASGAPAREKLPGTGAAPGLPTRLACPSLCSCVVRVGLRIIHTEDLNRPSQIVAGRMCYMSATAILVWTPCVS